MIVRHRGDIVFWLKEGLDDKPPSIPFDSVLLFEKDKRRYLAYINSIGVYFINSLEDIANVKNAYDLDELHDFYLTAFCYLITPRDILSSCLRKMGLINLNKKSVILYSA